ncbi:MAG: RHS repeat protein [Planctomycetaceae bacterium]|nr:RHS repeat protein [Planctomycetaceae bacterium]
MIQAVDLAGDGLDVTTYDGEVPLAGADVLRTQTKYDNVGRAIQSTDALGHVTQTLYDGAGRMTATVFEDLSRTLSVYDALGRRVAEIAQHDPLAPDFDVETIITYHEYDDLGRQTSRTLPLGVIAGSGFTELTVYNDASLAAIDAGPDPRASSVGLGQLEYAVDLEGRL